MGEYGEAVSADLAEKPAADGRRAGPATDTESVLAEVLADVVQVERISVDSNFFDDLNADSLVMARFCARVRKRPDVPSVSMKDIYRHPTIRSLAAALTDDAPDPTAGAAAPGEQAAEPHEPARTGEYVLCGALQLAIFLGYTYLSAVVIERGYEWVTAGGTVPEMYLRSVEFGAATLVAFSVLPIIAKWVLIGRWKPQKIRIWSLAYLRFWLVRTLIRANPILLFAGSRSRSSSTSPIYVLYLRALGAKVGRDVAIYSRNMPVCTDLLTIGDGTVIRKDVYVNCYRAHRGMIETGPVTLGKDVYVGEATVIDIGASMGDGSQLGHASSLHAGQAVPDGERWHGSPAQPTEVDYRVVEPLSCSLIRKTVYALGQVLTTVFLYLPLGIAGVTLILAEFPPLEGILHTEQMAFTHWTFYRDALIASLVLFFGAVLFGLLLVASAPRVLNLVMRPGRTYRLYGFHYTVHRLIAFLTNNRFFGTLFGDSSYIVGYLRWIGYDLSRVEQTGSNFGTVVRHETPFQVTVGSGTMVADGLSIINADFSNTSFTLSRAAIGPHNFLGNNITYPAQSRTAENCLLATKVLVPLDGEIRRNTGLLGSPSFRIPRSVERDSRFDHMGQGEEFRRRLAAKNTYNVRTMGWFLLVRWVFLLGITVLGLALGDYFRMFNAAGVAAEMVVALLFTMTYFVLVERAVAGFRPLRPQFCSIYERYFWWHERYWKMANPGVDAILAGTPFKNIVSRLLGVRIGKRVFDDGCGMPEKTLVSIGDDCTLNAGSTIQCHSQEDGTFKSDRTTIGDRCTLDVGSFVHYGVTVSDDVVLAPGCFVMKGEEIPQGARWGGNPAREIAPSATVPVIDATVVNAAAVNASAVNGAEVSGATVNGGTIR